TPPHDYHRAATAATTARSCGSATLPHDYHRAATAATTARSRGSASPPHNYQGAATAATTANLASAVQAGRLRYHLFEEFFDGIAHG
ncbi:MAG: hypothetical protein NTZ09_05690, partial [Candidatus Hydrogenedentes bacterium]|nr:hypothetical protein [Candidatus Hydrogenedentota bacterium]